MSRTRRQIDIWGLDVFYGDLEKPMPKVTKEGNHITATVDGTTWILNLLCLVARLDSKCFEKQVFQLQSSDDSFNEDNDIKVDFQTDDGEIVCYYTCTLDHTQLIDHPNFK